MKKIRKINLVKTKISKVTYLQLDVLKAGADQAGAAQSQKWLSKCVDKDTCQSQTHGRTTENNQSFGRG